eukprot:GHVU01138005.1.p2 GENE.GHVU01138005.1~~GHVU01138005.1.p2  ORF type:complete len:144 (-),score=25.91 GHVU01138005.1:173-604(-)
MMRTLKDALDTDPTAIICNPNISIDDETELAMPNAEDLTKAIQLAKPVKMGKEGYYIISLPASEDTTDKVELNKVDISSPLSWAELGKKIREDNNLDDEKELEVFAKSKWININDLKGHTGEKKIFTIAGSLRKTNDETADGQ